MHEGACRPVDWQAEVLPELQGRNARRGRADVLGVQEFAQGEAVPGLRQVVRADAWRAVAVLPQVPVGDAPVSLWM